MLDEQQLQAFGVGHATKVCVTVSTESVQYMLPSKNLRSMPNLVGLVLSELLCQPELHQLVPYWSPLMLVDQPVPYHPLMLVDQPVPYHPLMLVDQPVPYHPLMLVDQPVPYHPLMLDDQPVPYHPCCWFASQCHTTPWCWLTSQCRTTPWCWWTAPTVTQAEWLSDWWRHHNVLFTLVLISMEVTMLAYHSDGVYHRPRLTRLPGAPTVRPHANWFCTTIRIPLVAEQRQFSS